MNRTVLAARIRATSRLTGSFVLRSGVSSSVYFDKFQFEADPSLLRAIAEQLAPMLAADTEVLAGLELGGIPVVTVLSQVTGLPAAFLRKAAKTYGTGKYAEGPPLAGRNVVLVEDVVSSGGAIIDALSMLHADGIRPGTALCVIDRESGGAETLRAAGVELRALFKMREIDAAV
jgi:orotate phosphoribosyltransferase